MFSPLLFVLTAFIFIGMLELAKLFSDPYERTADSAFPLHEWFEKYLENSMALLEHQKIDGAYDVCGNLDQAPMPAWDAEVVSSLIDQPLEKEDEGMIYEWTPRGSRLLVPVVRHSRPAGHYEVQPSRPPAIEIH